MSIDRRFYDCWACGAKDAMYALCACGDYLRYSCGMCGHTEIYECGEHYVYHQRIYEVCPHCGDHVKLFPDAVEAAVLDIWGAVCPKCGTEVMFLPVPMALWVPIVDEEESEVE